MSARFEPLESRRLCSASAATLLAAVTQVRTDATALQADLTAALPTYQADLTAVTADVAALPKTKANRRPAARLKGDDAKLTAGVTADGRKLEGVAAGKAEQRLVADVTAAVLSPSDAAAQKRLAADVKRAQKASAGPVAKLRSVLTTVPGTLAADLAALVLANPSSPTLAADAAKAGADVAAVASTVGPELTTAQADLATLLADLQG